MILIRRVILYAILVIFTINLFQSTCAIYRYKRFTNWNQAQTTGWNSSKFQKHGNRNSSVIRNNTNIWTGPSTNQTHFNTNSTRFVPHRGGHNQTSPQINNQQQHNKLKNQTVSYHSNTTRPGFPQYRSPAVYNQTTPQRNNSQPLFPFGNSEPFKPATSNRNSYYDDGRVPLAPIPGKSNTDSNYGNSEPFRPQTSNRNSYYDDGRVPLAPFPDSGSRLYPDLSGLNTSRSSGAVNFDNSRLSYGGMCNYL